MSLDPLLLPGISAYRENRFPEAAESFRGASRQAGQEGEILLEALSQIASAAADPGIELSAASNLALISKRALGLDVAFLRAQLASGKRRPELREASALSKRAIARFALLLVLAASGFAALRWTPLAEFADKDRVVFLLEGLRGAWWSPFALVGLFAILVPIGVPATPLVIAGGVVFGVYAGTLYNYLGTMIGGVTSYWLARALGKELVEHVLGERLRKVEHLVEKHGFWTLVRLRFFPIPYTLFNFSCALTGIRFPLFISSTGLAMALTTAVWTYFWASMALVAAGQKVEGVYLNLVLALASLFMLTFVPKIARGVWRRRRLLKLRAERAGR